MAAAARPVLCRIAGGTEAVMTAGQATPEPSPAPAGPFGRGRRLIVTLAGLARSLRPRRRVRSAAAAA